MTKFNRHGSTDFFVVSAAGRAAGRERERERGREQRRRQEQRRGWGWPEREGPVGEGLLSPSPSGREGEKTERYGEGEMGRDAARQRGVLIIDKVWVFSVLPLFFF